MQIVRGVQKIERNTTTKTASERSSEREFLSLILLNQTAQAGLACRRRRWILLGRGPGRKCIGLGGLGTVKGH